MELPIGIRAARSRDVLAIRVVDLENRQLDPRLRASTDVLDQQTRLANARTDEIAALVDDQIPQVELAFASGTLLGRDRIIWSSYGGSVETQDDPVGTQDDPVERQNGPVGTQDGPVEAQDELLERHDAFR